MSLSIGHTWVRRIVGLLLVAGTAGWWGAVAPAHASTTKYFFEYKGSYSEKYSIASNGDPTPTFSESLTWDVKIYADSEGTVVEHSLVAQGTNSDSGDYPGNDWTCTFQQDAAPNLEGFTIGPGDDPGTARVSFFIPQGVDPNGQLTASGTFTGGQSCAQAFAGATVTSLNADGSQINDCDNFLASPTFTPSQTLNNVKADGHTQKYAATQSLTVPANCHPGVTLTGTRTIDATVTVGHGGPPVTTPGGPPTGKEDQDRAKIKAAALVALRQHFTQALYPCLVATSGGTLATSGFLMTFSPGFGGGLSLLSAGSAMVGVAGPICARLVSTIVDEAQTVNDPPISDFEQLATVAPARRATAASVSCTQYTTKSRSLCKQLGSALEKLDTRLGPVASVAAALKTTIGRESAAIAANDASAAHKQYEHAVHLDKQLDAAEKAQTKASEHVAAVLRTYHIAIQLTSSNDQSAIAALENELAAKGLTAAELTAALGAAPTPAPLDAAAEFAHPYH